MDLPVYYELENTNGNRDYRIQGIVWKGQRETRKNWKFRSCQTAQKKTNPAVEIHGLKKGYGKGSARTEVLKGLDFETEAGDFCVIMGASGCGKSTLMSILCGIEPVEEGTCKVNGLELKKLTDQELAAFRSTQIGIVFQSFFLDEARALEENVEMPMGYSGVKKKQRRAQAQEVLSEFHLAELAKKRPSQFSGGEQQRAAIARAVVNHPKLLIADEPTGNLDEENTKNVMELLTRLNENGMGIILVTHDPYAASFAKRKYVLEHGVLKEKKES